MKKRERERERERGKRVGRQKWNVRGCERKRYFWGKRMTTQKDIVHFSMTVF